MLFDDLKRKLKEKVNTIAAFLEKALNKLSAKIKLDKIPKEKQKPMFIILGVVLLFLIILIPAANAGKSKKAAGSILPSGLSIPSDELFFPDEPDFMPEYILEREPRGFWSLEEIRRYWKVPQHTELWKNQIKSAVDNLMEGVQ